MSTLKILYTVNPRHVHADFYFGEEDHTFALNGHLVFSREEWDMFKEVMEKDNGVFAVQMRNRSE